MGIFGILATPLGFVLKLVYGLCKNYFISIFLFTLLIRLLMFPLSLRSQKTQAERIRLAPRLERLQKKYSQDRQKLQEKTAQLYEKEGVSMTGGCLPSIIQMIILMGVISVIYAPLSYLSEVPKTVVDASVNAVNIETYAQKDEDGKPLKDENGNLVYIEGADLSNKAASKDLTGYYRELNMMQRLESNREDILDHIVSEAKMTETQAQEYYDQMMHLRKDFTIGSLSLLKTPGEGGFSAFGWLWLIPLISGLTSALSSFISLRFSKMGMSPEQQPGQGCSNVMMIVLMPCFSLYISFVVPGAVGIYWICSNLISLLQVYVLNMIYNPKKIRAEAIAADEARRKKRAEDKKRLAEARQRELEERREEKRQQEEAAKNKAAKPSNKKPSQPTKNPNKLKKKENSDGGFTIEPGELKEPDEESVAERDAEGTTGEEPEKES